MAIARALVNSPRMIIADEPTGNLDPVRSLELMLLLEKINELGTTLLVVTHEKELVNAFSKRVVAITTARSSPTEWTGISAMKLSRLGYLIKSGFTGIFSHGLMSFATVTITMACLIIMGSFGLLVVNINELIADLEQENEVVAFIDENLTEEEARAIEPLIEAVPNVSGADFVSRAEAMENFQEDYDPRLFDSLDASVFRDRYIIHLTDVSLTAQTKADLEAVDGVADVNAHLEYAEAFITVRNVVSIVSLALIIILIVVSFFIMSNTIKLATFTRREEIAIMRMVGASNGFIRCPFVIEGLVLGLVGGLLAFGIEIGLYSLLLGKVMGGVAAGLSAAARLGRHVAAAYMLPGRRRARRRVRRLERDTQLPQGLNPGRTMKKKTAVSVIAVSWPSCCSSLLLSAIGSMGAFADGGKLSGPR